MQELYILQILRYLIYVEILKHPDVDFWEMMVKVRVHYEYIDQKDLILYGIYQLQLVQSLL